MATASTDTWHPLFPRREGEVARSPQIAVFHVQKYLDGEYKTIPIDFGPEDLTSNAEIADRWGGGRYQLVARDEHAHIVRKERLCLSGPARSIAELAQPGAAQLVPAAAELVPMNGSHGPAAWLPFIGAITPVALAWFERSRQAAEAASRSQHELYMTLLSRGESSAREQVSGMGTLYKGMADTMAAMVARQGGGDSGAFMKGIELGRDLMAGITEQQDDDSSTLQVISGVLEALKETGAPPPFAVPPPNPEPEPEP